MRIGYLREEIQEYAPNAISSEFVIRFKASDIARRSDGVWMA